MAQGRFPFTGRRSSISSSKNQHQMGKQTEKLSTVLAIELEGVHAVNSSGGWEEVKLAHDSGATEMVIPPHVLQGHELHEGAPFRRGVEYELAHGVQIPNLEEKRFVGLTNEGVQKAVVAQICDVNRGLLSVKKVTNSGNRVVFDQDESYIENKRSGERTPLKETGGMYELSLWVKRKDF